MSTDDIFFWAEDSMGIQGTPSETKYVPGSMKGRTPDCAVEGLLLSNSACCGKFQHADWSVILCLVEETEGGG